MHGSAIAGLAFRASSNGVAPPYLAATIWFLSGMVLALGSGFAAWWNFSFAANQYNDWAKPNMVFDRNHWPGPPKHHRKITSSLWAAIICGNLSIICLLAGAIHVFLVWH